MTKKLFKFSAVKTMLPLFLSVATGLSSHSVYSAPVLSSSSLPLDDKDIVEASEVYKDETELHQFASFIKSLSVYPDHENPKTVSGMGNRTLVKTYYIAPNFKVPADQKVVGAQEIAKSALELLTEIQDLTTSFDYELILHNEIQAQIVRNTKVKANLQDSLATVTDPVQKATIEGLIADLERTLAKLKIEAEEITQEAEDGLDLVSDRFKQSIARQIRLKLSFLSVEPTPEEEAQFDSGEPNEMVKAIESMVARATSQGQFGVRQGIFTTGYSKRETDFISTYRRIRGDVQVNLLSTTTVFARPAALTTNVGTDGRAVARNGNATRLFAAVNAGTQGRCGNTRSCNAVIDLTYMGAMMAQNSKRGAITFPVVFDANVKVSQPDFHGEVECDFKTGWSVKGRADVKDGWAIYDGDIYNRLHYKSLEEGGCDYEIYEGDADSAAYYTIKRIYDNYMRLKMMRGMKSSAQKDAYKAEVDRELKRHQSQAQHTNYDTYSYVRWFGGPFGSFVSRVINFGRSIYWHTRIEDSSTEDAVKFKTTIKESNVQKTERFTFDGNTLMCWKLEGLSISDAYLGSCPEGAGYEEKADTDLGHNDDHDECIDNPFTSGCEDQVDDTDDNVDTDDNDVILDPWG